MASESGRREREPLMKSVLFKYVYSTSLSIHVLYHSLHHSHVHTHCKPLSVHCNYYMYIYTCIYIYLYKESYSMRSILSDTYMYIDEVGTGTRICTCLQGTV